MRDAKAGRLVVVLVWYLLKWISLKVFWNMEMRRHTKGFDGSWRSTFGSGTFGIHLGCTETKELFATVGNMI